VSIEVVEIAFRRVSHFKRRLASQCLLTRGVSEEPFSLAAWVRDVDRVLLKWGSGEGLPQGVHMLRPLQAPPNAVRCNRVPAHSAVQGWRGASVQLLASSRSY
jgi:hypothetical protein